MKRRLFIICILGFSSGLPLNLLTSTLQAWFADAGLSVMTTSMLSLVGFPYLLRPVLSPILDRYTLFSIGKRRSWILSMHILIFLGINVLGFYSPAQSFQLIGVIALLISFLSTLQDGSIDAHRTEYLVEESYYGLGASLAVTGFRLAMLLTGGLGLLMATQYGWHNTYHILSLAFLPGIVAIIKTKEPRHDCRIYKTSIINDFINPFKTIFSQKGIVSLIVFAFLYKLGEAFTTSTSGIIIPFLIQGMGFSLKTIALVNKVFGVVAIIAGGLLSGFILLRASLYTSLMVFGLVQALTNGLFIVLAMSGDNVYILTTAVIADNLVAGMGTTALVALFMKLVDKRYTATQLSLLIAIANLPRIISGPMAASIQERLGWVGMYQVSVILALLFIPFLLIVKKRFNLGTHSSLNMQPI